MIREQDIKMWKRLVKENIQVKEIEEEIYIFGSEKACRRIEQAYGSPKIKAQCSDAYKSNWYVCLGRSL